MDASQEKEGRDLISSSRSEFLFSQMEYLPERVAPVSVWYQTAVGKEV